MSLVNEKGKISVFDDYNGKGVYSISYVRCEVNVWNRRKNWNL